ncbi:MAG: ATP phosphoribosyltransferase regulatory subunit [Gammaproteobacteria bacterium]|nr:ATP phosphoribosyltransferase regulatory subunit [Gammaproteobacteria bacterium]MCP5459211.1 ATP phosphoribosyltransferase regulatory subunit [Gammaproteobacteria bacterium]
MAIDDRWLLPDGIEELLPPEARRLESLRQALLSLYDSWGYEQVIPPFVEFLESLLTGTGNDLDLQTFKLTDQLSGRLLGVRADMTPQVARIDAHLRRDALTRFCYMGTVLRTRGDGFGGSRSPIQVGAELYGHDGYESDVEILRLMLQTLAVAGLAEVHLDLGHVAIYRGLARQAALTQEQERLLFDALQRKALPEIQEQLHSYTLGTAMREMLLALAELHGGEDVLDSAAYILREAPRDVQQALATLRQTAAAVRRQEPDLPIHCDLAELRGYHYHTGLVFAAYVPGYGQAVAKGGRYDGIARVFGHARPATGFSADLRTLLALSATREASPTGIFAPEQEDPALEHCIAALRRNGTRVIRALPGARADPLELGCDRILSKHDGVWRVEPLNADS